MDLDLGPFAHMNASSSSTSGKAVDEVSKKTGQAVIAYRWDSSSRNVFTKGLASKDSQTTPLTALLFTY